MPNLTPYDRARGRLSDARAREQHAKREHTAAQARLEQARRRDTHPRRELVRQRDAASKLLAKRRAQTAAAKRAVAKAAPKHPGNAHAPAKAPSRDLTPRGRALDWLSDHRGITEQPAGSNRDTRRDGILAAQQAIGPWVVGQAWCGTWCAAALHAGGIPYDRLRRLPSVALIEEDAKAHRAPFRGWTTDPRAVLRGDLVVLFGYGVHVETVREVHLAGGYLVTDGGNTSSGNAGSQANGGGAFRRVRSFRDVRGFALVDYPGH